MRTYDVEFQQSGPPGDADRLADPPDERAIHDLAAHVLAGLTAPQKYLPSRYFYDDEGSRLFQRIMALPEYYLTRVEHEILVEHGTELARTLGDGTGAVELIELGSGDGEKSATLCAALSAAAVDVVYRPIDLSPFALDALRRRFADRLPSIEVRPVVGDYFERWPSTNPEHRQAVLLMGSNLGNLPDQEAVALLRRIRAQLRRGDLLVLGLDLQKDPFTIVRAYDDRAGVTAQFNVNLLRRLNRELEMDFVLGAFRHYVSYDPLDGVVRSFLVSQANQRVHSARLDYVFSFRKGEAMYTERSQKYTHATIARYAAQAGFDVWRHFQDAQAWYTVVVLRVGDPGVDFSG